MKSKTQKSDKTLVAVFKKTGAKNINISKTKAPLADSGTALPALHKTGKTK